MERCDGRTVSTTEMTIALPGWPFSGDTLYVAGYYKAAGIKQAVITLLNANDGSHLTSTNIYYGNLAYQEQITGLEVYGGTISYGLYVTGASGGIFSNEIMLVQTDMAGNLRFPASYASDAGSDLGGSDLLKPIRSADSGFYVLRTVSGNYAGPGVAKINKYGVEEWGLAITPGDEYSIMDGMDVTVDGGIVVTGWFQTYLATFSDAMWLVKVTTSGEIGSCKSGDESMATGTISYQQKAFTWGSEPTISTLLQAATHHVTSRRSHELDCRPGEPHLLRIRLRLNKTFAHSGRM